jgi:hypothetical protein
LWISACTFCVLAGAVSILFVSVSAFSGNKTEDASVAGNNTDVIMAEGLAKQWPRPALSGESEQRTSVKPFMSDLFITYMDETKKRRIYYDIYSALKLAEIEERRRRLTPDDFHEIDRIDDEFAKRLVYDKYNISETEGLVIMAEGIAKQWPRPALSY